MQQSVVIIGGGLGGAQVAIQLRQRRWAGPITILSRENVAPYWRPTPLQIDPGRDRGG